MKVFKNESQKRLEEIHTKVSGFINNHTIHCSKAKLLLEHMDELKTLLTEYIEFESFIPFNNGEPVIDKDGKIYLVGTIFRQLDKETNEWRWHEVGVVDAKRVEHKVKIEDLAPYTQTAQVLYSKKG